MTEEQTKRTGSRFYYIYSCSNRGNGKHILIN